MPVEKRGCRCWCAVMQALLNVWQVIQLCVIIVGLPLSYSNTEYMIHTPNLPVSQVPTTSNLQLAHLQAINTRFGKTSNS